MPQDSGKKPQSNDPLDLPLIVIPPDPNSISARYDRMQAASPGAVPQPSKPDLAIPGPQASATAAPAADPLNPSGHRNLLDKVIFALTGTPDAALAPEDAKARAGRRREAGAMASNAANGDLGDSYMDAPKTSGSGFGLSDIISFVSKVI